MEEYIEGECYPEEEEYSSEEIYEMKPNHTKVKKNIEDFDMKVAAVITQIHRKKFSMEFTKWVNKNYSNLMKMYKKIPEKMDQEKFFLYVYKNSV